MAEILNSEITCPACREKSGHPMPTDSCQFFLKCPQCGKLLKPKKGDCCVFCSYGSNPCPPVQKEKNVVECFTASASVEATGLKRNRFICEG